MTSRAPPLLEPYLGLPPEASLVVLSGVIGASTNWLVLRYISSLLKPGTAGGGDELPDAEDPGGGDTAVLLVSFLRDFGFWRDGAGRLGVDLASLSRKGRFGFVDGLTGLFSSSPSQQELPGTAVRRLAWGQQKTGMQTVAKTLHEAVDDLLCRGGDAGGGGVDGDSRRRRRIVLVVDQPDLLLAAAGPDVSVADVHNLLLDLREKAHACVVTLSADEPLVSAQTTTLEREHAALLLSLAHEARLVLSLRLLDTGTANDVSGVLRITRGGGTADDDDAGAVEEHEYLYQVGGDGGVRVFDRGGGH